MNNEYIQIHEQLNFSLKELYQVSLNGIETAFIDEGMKIELSKQFAKEYNEIASQVVG
jgi:adenosine deaminase